LILYLHDEPARPESTRAADCYIRRLCPTPEQRNVPEKVASARLKD
jgi:hypothetical protein